MTFKCQSCLTRVSGKDMLPFALQGRALCQECYFSKINVWNESLRQEASLLLRTHSDSILEIPTLKKEYSWNTIVNMIINFFSKRGHINKEEKDDIV